MADSRQLEFEKGGLVGIAVDAIDGCGLAQQIIQGVATGAGDGRNSITRTNRKRDAVHIGIFPTLVVDQISFVNLIEQPLFHHAIFKAYV